ncbi:type 2 lantibiotic biosynthesis protein [Dulcicalothrix desertica PCC 7102]|uniref:Type 2 lantibiotic biosynthesis protein n=1 Tax=Dulcicalothrix desertica PCC 7102 TaxID=232991 RepID=A0A3S1CK94_9CYAN|nr:type 2 lanthipeptide synthetase LanM family protein [Dulcicalothrix desertica]RUT04384.1 type 2 lantibiotic biosynthesis protein [Dulcicalothrix desertica PCC 7102]TWH51238.1 type 2 lantibiotic biosynthesis protein LanM [Dulcicalothrix desertica PCC 7102]
MLVTHEWLVKVVEKSSTISERLGDDFWYNVHADSDVDVTLSQIAKWRQLIAGDNEAKFEKRLSWDNIDLHTVGKAISCACLVNENKLPTWTETLKGVLSASKAPLSSQYLLDAENLLPFEEIFLPFIYIARQKLEVKLGFYYPMLSAKSYGQLERNLLEYLTELCDQTLAIEFHIFQTYKQPSLVSRLGKIQNSHSREQYNRFVEKMLSGGLLDFFEEYSVLARMVATVTDYWVDNTCEFIYRLATDWSDIQQTFQNNSQLGQVVDIRPGISDRHNKGRSVYAITFSSGLKLIYKPKDLGLEETFFELLAYLNYKGIALDLQVLKIINRFQYGWVEYVDYTALKHSGSAIRYYQRSGMLLCILYALSGADFHQENIIACGEQPVAIDLEMLMSAIVRLEETPEDMQDAFFLANLQFSQSVLSTSFLPKWEVGRNGEVYDLSALGGVGGQETSKSLLIWQNINTDGMVLSNEYVEIEPCHNIPILNGTYLSANDYTEEVVDGFRQMYQFLMAHRDTLLIDSPLTKLQKQQVRAIYRPRQVYASLLQEALQPKNLRDGADLSIALDVLCKAFLEHEHRPLHWDIIAAEKQALVHLDIPFFVTSSNSDKLQINPHQYIERYFIEPSYKLVVNRLHQLCEDNLEQQIVYIRTSMYARNASDIKSIALSTPAVGQNLEKNPLFKEVFVYQAVKIAQEMQHRAVRAGTGSVCWMGIDYLPESGQIQPKPMGYDLYNGSSGVALFLAALTKVTNNQEFRDLANAALQPINHLLQNSVVRKQKLIRQIGIGAGKGIGSIVYTLVRCSQFLKEPQIINYALTLVKLISPEDIYRDQKFDIVSGAAGCILGLITLYKATGHALPFKLAKICGDHLVNSGVTSSTGHLTTGIAHGTAGIAYALLRLHDVTNNSVYLEAAAEAIAYERSVYSLQELSISWCDGAPGIALARLGCLPILNNEEIHNDIEKTLETTQKIGLQNIDNLCYGNFGRIETLLVAAQRSNLSKIVSQGQLNEIIQKQVATLIENAEKTGLFQIFPGYQSLYNPGFFQGTAGIGYQLLRLAYPEMFPSVLLWN